MTGELARRIEAELASSAPEAVVELAQALADPARDAAILYYGSTLRTGDLSGILDFYRLTRRPHRRLRRPAGQGEGRPDEQQPDTEPEADQGAHGVSGPR